MNTKAFLQRHDKLTRSLKKFILDYEAQLPGETYEAFLESLHEALETASEQIQSAPTGPARAQRLQELVDQEIASEQEIAISCRKGCSACCHMEVEVTSYEAEVIANLVKAGHQIDHERLEKQSLRDLQDRQWKEGPRNPTSRCVFLNEEGACSIYANRPVMCRRHSVTSPAQNCDSLEAPITLRYFPRVDVLISAANEDSNLTIGPLAKMLLLHFPKSLASSPS